MLDWQLCQICYPLEIKLLLLLSLLLNTRNSVIKDIPHEVNSVLDKSCFTDLIDNEKN